MKLRNRKMTSRVFGMIKRQKSANVTGRGLGTRESWTNHQAIDPVEYTIHQLCHPITMEQVFKTVHFRGLKHSSQLQGPERKPIVHRALQN